MKNHYIGILAILLGVLALGLSVYLIEKKQELEEQRISKVNLKTDFTFKFGKKEFTVGSNSREKDSEDFPEIKRKEDEIQSLNLSMISFACLAFVLVPISWIKEKNKAISIISAAFPVMAIAWQFIVIGIAAGIAIAILLIILSSFAA